MSCAFARAKKATMRSKSKQRNGGGEMKTTEAKYRALGLILALGVVLFGVKAFAQEAKPVENASKVEAPAPAVAPAPAPKLPAYFTATNDDPKKPAWPDPTGAATGVWATPAGDGKGDIPDQLKINDLYDRMVHNLYSINYVWVLIAGFLVMFMQAGFMLVETGLCRAKNAAHTSAMNFLIY